MDLLSIVDKIIDSEKFIDENTGREESMTDTESKIEEYIRTEFPEGFYPERGQFRMMIRKQFGDVNIALSNIQSRLFRRSNGFCFFKD